MQDPRSASVLLPRLAGLACALGVVAACYGRGSGETDAGTSSTPAPRADGSAETGDDDGGAVAQRGLPCDVDALLRARCRACHGAGQTELPHLVTYEDLTAPAPSTPERPLAAVALERLTAATDPMPPAPLPRVDDAQVAALRAWIDRGLPREACGGPADAGPDAGPDAVAPHDAGPRDAALAVDAAAACASGRYWSATSSGPDMNPGRACITCHVAQTNERKLHVGGTVYARAGEPDRCYGVDAGAGEIVVTDAVGTTRTLAIGPTGNFSLLESAATLVFPLQARIVRDGVASVKQTPTSSGDCNACHGAVGANGAAGRLVLP